MRHSLYKVLKILNIPALLVGSSFHTNTEMFDGYLEGGSSTGMW